MRLVCSGRIELGYADNIKFNFINSYRVNNYFSLGFGFGARYYPDAELVLVPVFLDARSRFLTGKISPYFALAVGYTFSPEDGFTGVGALINPQIGVSILTSSSSDFTIGLGYDIQKFKDFYYIYNGRTASSNAISLNIGISF